MNDRIIIRKRCDKDTLVGRHVFNYIIYIYIYIYNVFSDTPICKGDSALWPYTCNDSCTSFHCLLGVGRDPKEATSQLIAFISYNLALVCVWFQGRWSLEDNFLIDLLWISCKSGWYRIIEPNVFPFF